MPMIRFDVIEGRTDEEIRKLLDAAHRAVLTSFSVPTGDRYQIITEHKSSRLVMEDTGLSLERTRDVVVVSVTTRPRSQESKQTFYFELCKELKEACGIEPCDVIVSIVTNGDDDWSFGNGAAQYLTGEL